MSRKLPAVGAAWTQQQLIYSGQRGLSSVGTENLGSSLAAQTALCPRLPTTCILNAVWKSSITGTSSARETRRTTDRAEHGQGLQRRRLRGARSQTGRWDGHGVGWKAKVKLNRKGRGSSWGSGVPGFTTRARESHGISFRGSPDQDNGPQQGTRTERLGRGGPRGRPRPRWGKVKEGVKSLGRGRKEEKRPGRD